MDDNYIMRQYVLDKTKEYLGDKWVHYGLEIVEFADSLSKNMSNISDLDGYIARSIYNMIMRRKIEESKRVNISVDDLAMGYESKHNVVTYIDESRVFLERFLEKNLSESDMDIYILRFIKGCTIYSIAEDLDIPPRTVYARLKHIMDIVMEYK